MQKIYYRGFLLKCKNKIQTKYINARIKLCQMIQKNSTSHRSIKDLNDEFFGSDKTKNYILDDFRRVVECFIQIEVLKIVYVDCSKRLQSQKVINKDEKISSGTYGVNDPDNALLLYSIIRNLELSMMIELRLLLTSKEKMAGGKFINKLNQLNFYNFINFYIYLGENRGMVIPPFLQEELLLVTKSNPSINWCDFICKHSHDIPQKVDELLLKVKQFNSKEYFKELIDSYQGLKFHKDNFPEKFNVKNNKKSNGNLKISVTTIKNKDKIDFKKIAECLNEFAEIIFAYRSLVHGNWNNVNYLSINEYITQIFTLFRIKISPEVSEKFIKDIKENLNQSLDLLNWN